jgi:hypothetical protein
MGRHLQDKRRPCQPDPSTCRSRCRCSLPGLTGFTGKTVWEDRQDRLHTLSQIAPTAGKRAVRISVIVYTELLSIRQTFRQIGP